MKLLPNIKTLRKFTALLLIFNFLILGGVISYHYHKIDIRSEYSQFSEDAHSNSSDGSYSYLTCPIIHYSSTAFQFYLNDNKTFSASEFSEVVLFGTLNFTAQFSKLNYNLRAPPTLS